MSDEYVYLQNKNWRGITYDWDILSNYGENTKLYCLTDFQVAWLLSTTQYMSWSTRWENCPCTDDDLIDMKAELDYRLMSCIDLSPWQIQSIYDNLNNGLLTDYIDSWDGSDPQSVNPDAPTTYFNGDSSPDRLDALCSALVIFVYSYSLVWSQKASFANNLLNLTAFLAGLLMPLGGEIAVKAIQSLGGPLQAQLDALANQTALDTVICDWKDLLYGETITPANFTDTIQSLSYTVDSDPYYIQQLLASDTQLLENFLTFVNCLGTSYELAQIGVSICPCPDIWEYTFDFTVDDGGFTILPLADPTGVYVASTGWRAQSDGGGNETRLYIKLEGLDPYNLTRLRTTMTFTGDTSVGYNAFAIVGKDSGGSNVTLYNNTAIGNANTTFDFSLDGDAEDLFQIQLYRTGFLPSPAPINTILTMTLNGNGENPFI